MPGNTKRFTRMPQSGNQCPREQNSSIAGISSAESDFAYQRAGQLMVDEQVCGKDSMHYPVLETILMASFARLTCVLTASGFPTSKNSQGCRTIHAPKRARIIKSAVLPRPLILRFFIDQRRLIFGQILRVQLWTWINARLYAARAKFVSPPGVPDRHR